MWPLCDLDRGQRSSNICSIAWSLLCQGFVKIDLKNDELWRWQKKERTRDLGSIDPWYTAADIWPLTSRSILSMVTWSYYVWIVFGKKMYFGHCDPCMTLTGVKGHIVDRRSQGHVYVWVSRLRYVMQKYYEHFSENKLLTPVTLNDLGSTHTTISFVEGFKVNHVLESRDHTMYL